MRRGMIGRILCWFGWHQPSILLEPGENLYISCCCCRCSRTLTRELLITRVTMVNAGAHPPRVTCEIEWVEGL